MVGRIDLLYSKYLDENMKKTIGGVQTYISDLVKLFESKGIVVRIIQFSKENFEYKLSDKSSVLGVKVCEKNVKKRYQALYDYSVQTAENTEGLLTIFATDNIIPSRVTTKAAAIQHGIFWDIPLTRKRPAYKRVISRAIHTETIIKSVNKVDCLICVDHNFLNWYRTQVDYIENNICVIPNYTAIPPVFEKEDDVIRIIFARRLFDYRGTKVFAKAAKKILDNYSNVHITVAGSGPDEAWMKEQLQSYENVSFITYESEDSLRVHSDKHIAVVPTVGSEGTSLSLLEAMAAQCAVVCTNVGGMTNIVLDGYNGIFTSPGNEKELYEAIAHLIENPDKIKQIAKNAYETVSQSFSHEEWKQKWLKIVDGI